MLSWWYFGGNQHLIFADETRMPSRGNWWKSFAPHKLLLLESVRRDEVISSLGELGALLCWKSSSTLFLIPATDKWQLSDRQLIVIVCLLLIIHAVCLSRSQKTRVVLLFRVWRGWSGGGEGGGALKCFVSPCAPRVTKSTTDGEQDKRSRDWSFFAFSSEVVTLTFPLAYVILPTPQSPCVFPLIPFLLALRNSAILRAFLKSRVNDNERLKVKFKARRESWKGWTRRLARSSVQTNGLRLCKKSITGMAWLQREQLWGIFFLAPWVFSESSEIKERLRWITKPPRPAFERSHGSLALGRRPLFRAGHSSVQSLFFVFLS